MFNNRQKEEKKKESNSYWMKFVLLWFPLFVFILILFTTGKLAIVWCGSSMSIEKQGEGQMHS